MLRSIRKWIRPFQKRDDGATAVEFSLIALPFIGMTVAILELGIYFLASRFMEDAVFRAGREFMTNRNNTASCADLLSKVQGQLPTLINPSAVSVSVSTAASVSAAGTPVATSATGCNTGGPDSILILTARYDYPFNGFRFIASGPLIGKEMPITASTAFRREK
jgi:Flp pilus assembly protein TadG